MVKNTPLLAAHRSLNGKIVEFAGFLMPLQYSGGVDEHQTVRTAVGLFDVSHMGEVLFTGPGALAAARRVVTNNVEGLVDGAVLYSPICYPDGGIVDDCLVYRQSAERVLFVVNAANVAKDFDWFKEQTGSRCAVTDVSDDYALIAIQGPRAVDVFAAVADRDVRAVPSFHFLEVKVGAVACTASRTGYTGEDGFEIACSPAGAPALWERLLEAGAAHGIKPCGLGARDTLRLEARLPLYGNDIDQSTTPLEAGLGWTVKLKEGDFIGRAPLLQQKQEGLKRKLVCLEMRSRGIARHGHAICLPGADGVDARGTAIAGERAAGAASDNASGALGAVIGQVTSGTTSPTLKTNIALGYVPSAHAAVGGRVLIDVRGKAVEAEIVKGPFYRRSGG